MRLHTFAKGLILATFSLSLTTVAAPKLRGKVAIDGSSTVYPITEAIAEEYRSEAPRVRVNIGVSGTGGGFKKFLKSEIDINDASRRIKDKEVKLAKKNNVNYTEFPVAFDGLTVVINPKNTWATSMTTAELKKLWDAGSKVKRWNQIRKEWPNREIKLYGPGTDSGTFDYFTKAINGKSGKSRSDFQKSEDDNVLVTGVSGDVDALGFFGFAYYKENRDKLQAVAISHKGSKAIKPTSKTINDGSYKPLSRPVFIYVNNAALKRPEVKSFVNFYFKTAPKLVSEVGYVPLTATSYNKSLKTVEKLSK
jgi:phosphate transport system substrate-binding protein